MKLQFKRVNFQIIDIFNVIDINKKIIYSKFYEDKSEYINYYKHMLNCIKTETQIFCIKLTLFAQTSVI